MDEILAEAQSGDYDLVAIGANRSRWQRVFLEDLTEQIVPHVDRPILIIK